MTLAGRTVSCSGLSTGKLCSSTLPLSYNLPACVRIRRLTMPDLFNLAFGSHWKSRPQEQTAALATHACPPAPDGTACPQERLRLRTASGTSASAPRANASPSRDPSLRRSRTFSMALRTSKARSLQTRARVSALMDPTSAWIRFCVTRRTLLPMELEYSRTRARVVTLAVFSRKLVRTGPLRSCHRHDEAGGDGAGRSPQRVRARGRPPHKLSLLTLRQASWLPYAHSCASLSRLCRRRWRACKTPHWRSPWREQGAWVQCPLR